MSYTVFDWQKSAWELSRAALARGAHALLFAGARGCGKRELALALAAAYLCDAPQPDGRACNQCESCRWLAAGSHPDFALVEPAAEDDDAEPKTRPAPKRSNAITVDQVRGLSDLMSITAHRDAGKAIVVHPAEALNVAASNALLKSLEEPPPRTVFLLVSHRPALLLPTVRSRCQLVPVRIDDPAPARAWLAANAECDDPELVLALAGGAPLAAVSIAEDPVWSRRAGFLRALAAPDADPVRIADLYRDLPPAQVLSWLQTWTFDLVQIRFCGRARYHRDMEPIAAGVAQLLEPIEATRLHRSLLALQRHVNHPLNARLFVEHMLIAYRQALAHNAIPV
ncbi:MAG: DNA polymerase III subunit delta' [Betaproteobacteria bacterium]|nr:DNA polymerase III subunit delta' [Betaproteobacteria bacterium]